MRKRFSTLSVFILTLFFIYGNFKVSQRSPTEDLLMDKTNIAFKDNEYVKAREDFVLSEVVTFLIDAQKTDAGWFKNYFLFISSAKKESKTVLDISNSPDFYIDDYEINTKPIIISDKISDDDWGRIINDPVLNIFALDDKSALLSFYFMPYAGEEIEKVERVVGFLESGHKSPAWRIWNFDFNYAWENVSGASWELARKLIHRGLINSTLTLWIIGSLLFLLPLFRLNLMSWRNALTAVLHIWIAFIWQRGLMGFFGIRESIFILLSYSVLFISGPSFILRSYEEDSKKTIFTVALFGVFGFLTLLPLFSGFGFEVLHIVELSYAAMGGIVCVYFLVVFVFPNFIVKSEYRNQPNLILYNRIIDFLVIRFKKSAIFLSDKNRDVFVAISIFGLFLFSAFLVITGRISTETRPTDYIKGYSVEKAMTRLQNHGPGHLPAYILIEHKDGLSITNHVFLRDAIGWLNDLERKYINGVSPVRKSFTLLKSIEELSCGERFCSEKEIDSPPHGLLGALPSDDIEVLLIWPYIENSLKEFKNYLWYEKGFFMALGIAADTDKELKEILDDIRKFNENYKDLKITFYGRNVIFSEIGFYLTRGKIVNMFSSNLTVVLFIFLLFMFWQHTKVKIISPLRVALVATAPFIFSLSIFLLFIWVMDKPLDAISSSISALAINAAGDLGIYFLKSLHKNLEKNNKRTAFEKTFDEEGPIIIKDAFLNMVGFLVLVLAFFAPVRELGFAMFFSMFFCLIGTLILMPPLMNFALRTDHPETFTLNK